MNENDGLQVNFLAVSKTPVAHGCSVAHTSGHYPIRAYISGLWMIVEAQYCSEIGPMLIHFIDLALAIHMNPYESIRTYKNIALFAEQLQNHQRKSHRQSRRRTVDFGRALSGLENERSYYDHIIDHILIIL